jgi:hypothetical protein
MSHPNEQFAQYTASQEEQLTLGLGNDDESAES